MAVWDTAGKAAQRQTCQEHDETAAKIRLYLPNSAVFPSFRFTDPLTSLLVSVPVPVMVAVAVAVSVDDSFAVAEAERHNNQL